MNTKMILLIAALAVSAPVAAADTEDSGDLGNYM